MDENIIQQSTADFPFKRVKKNRHLTFRQTRQRKGSKEGAALELEHNGHDDVALKVLDLHETPSGRQGQAKRVHYPLSTKEAVQLASVLMMMAETSMRDSAEEPYTMIVDAERAEMGPNWINEDFQTAIKRTENRKARSHLFGLMKRFVELCENEELLEVMTLNFTTWAQHSEDEFAMRQAEKAMFQLGFVDRSGFN